MIALSKKGDTSSHMTHYSHPRCYASCTNDCSTKISGEHYISDNILGDFEENKTVKITGLSWIPRHTFAKTSRKSLQANILCDRHNSQLSQYDSEAGSFQRCFREFDEDFNNSSPKNETRIFNGDFIEKWMLKTACGMIASKQIPDVILKELYVSILFNNVTWPESWGSYFKIPDDGLVQKFNSASILPMTGAGELKEAGFLFNNFAFNLILGKPSDPSKCGIFRIHKIHFTDGKITKTVELKWEDTKYTQEILLTRIGTTKEPPKEWDEYLKK